MTSPWRKSSRSENDGNCVEVINTLDAVRDSKNPTATLSGNIRHLVQALKSPSPMP